VSDDRSDVYYSLDIEADGPIPGRYSMLSFGLVVAGSRDGDGYRPADLTTTFYRELYPTGSYVDPEALAISGLDREALRRSGQPPKVALTEAAAWVTETAAGGKPVVVAYPVSFDCAFLFWYFVAFEVPSPFGLSDCLDIRTAYAIKAGIPIGRVRQAELPPGIKPQQPHTHHALDDAKAQAELFSNVMTWSGPS
jgi:DNA polymerase III epsilon subunit-like protein